MSVGDAGTGPIPTFQKVLPTVGRLAAAIRAPGSPLGLLVTPSGVWVSEHHAGVIRRINPTTNKVDATVKVVGKTAAQPGRMILISGSIFEMSYSGTRTVFVDPHRARLIRVLNAPRENCCWPVIAAGSLWLLGYSSAAAQHPNRLSRIDPRSGKVLATFKFASAQGLVYGAGSVWGVADGSVFRIDPQTNSIVTKIATDAQPFAYAAGSVWALDLGGSSAVSRIDPVTNKVVATIPLPSQGSTLTADDSAVWVTEGPQDSPGSHVWKIDPTTNMITGQVVIPARYQSALDDIEIGPDSSLWLACFDNDLVLRIRTT